MNRRIVYYVAAIFGAALLTALLTAQPVVAQLSFTPTFTPIPTATFGGPTVFAPEQVNLRLGPGTNYPQVGVLVAGQTAPALGRTLANEWILIQYFGAPNGEAWVYSPLVQIQAGTLDQLPEVEPPATPTLEPTPTFEPGFGPGGELLPTRLPTYTAPPPIAQPVFEQAPTSEGGLPPIVFVFALFGVGVLSALVVIIRRRS